MSDIFSPATQAGRENADKTDYAPPVTEKRNLIHTFLIYNYV